MKGTHGKEFGRYVYMYQVSSRDSKARLFDEFDAMATQITKVK